jgi:tripartite-type tricarboxylate transporter receptor subunit TctC
VDNDNVFQTSEKIDGAGDHGSGHTAFAYAESYPSKPITVIVVFAAGGPSDASARLLSDHVGRQFGQQVIVENVAGAGGTTGTDRAAPAIPDGYTILTHHSGLTAAPALYSNLKFDALLAIYFEAFNCVQKCSN